MKLYFLNVKAFASYALLVFIFSLFSITNVKAQDTEYWFVAPDASNQHGGCDRPTFIMITTGSEPAKVTISMPKNGVFTSVTKNIPANDYWQYYFGTTGQPGVEVIENSITTAGTKTNKGIHIKSETGPISVYYQVDGSCSKDIFTLKGKKALGQEFFAPFQSRYSRNNYTDAYAQIHILATVDGTKIDITPTLNIALAGSTSNAGTKTEITLDRGETFLVREYSRNLSSSLSGTHIKAQDASKPIVVTVADDPLMQPGGGSHDVTGDQLVPIDKIGTNYVVIRGFSSGATSDNVYILATKDNTQIFLNGSSTAIATINKGKTYHINMGGASGDIAAISALYIRTSEPAYCYQQSAIGNEMGAALLPSMYSIGTKKIIFYKQSMPQNHLFLIYRNGTAGGFRINGNTPSITSTAVPGMSDWQYARVDITSIAQGPCTVENLDGVFAMGYFCGNSTGTALYGFLSGFGQLEFPQITYKCLDKDLVLDAGYAKTYKWWKGAPSEEPADGSPLVLSTSNTYTVPANQKGQYSVRVNQDPFKVVATTKVVNDTYEAAVTAPKYAKKGSSQSLSATVTRPAGKTFAWTINGGTPASATTASTNTVWNTTGKYDVKLTIKNTDYHCNDTLIQRQVLVYDIKDDNVSIPKNRTATIDVLANDDFSAFDPTKITITIISAPTYGTAVLTSDNKKVTYTQTHGYTTSQDQLVYRVLYDGETVDQATVYIKTNSWLKVVKEGTNDDLAEPTTPGKFTFKYVDSGFKFDKAVKIHYEIGGTAVCGDDYIAPANFDCGTKKGFVMLGINAESVTLSITPKDNYKVEGNDRKIELTILSVEIP